MDMSHKFDQGHEVSTGCSFGCVCTLGPQQVGRFLSVLNTRTGENPKILSLLVVAHFFAYGQAEIEKTFSIPAAAAGRGPDL